MSEVKLESVTMVCGIEEKSIANLHSCFFSLLRIGVTKLVEDFPLLDSNEWKDIFKLGNNQAVSGILLEAINLLPVEKRPNKEIRLKFISLGLSIEERNKQTNIAAVDLCKDLYDAGFDPCILKGQGVATLYKNPHSRAPGDIDVWMRKPRQVTISYLESKYKTKVGLCYLHAIVPHNYKGVKVEYHFYPTFSYSPFINRKIQKYLNNNYKATLLSLPDEVGEIPIPNNEFNLIYLLNHIYRHLISEGIGIRQILDYYVFLNNHNKSISDREIISILKYLGMLSFAKGLMWVMKEIFNLAEDKLIVSVDENEGRFLLNEIMQSGNFGCIDNRYGTKKTTKLSRAKIKIRRSLHFVSHYPQEVIFRIPFMVYETAFYKMLHR